MLNKKILKMNLQEDYLEELAMNLNPAGDDPKDGSDEGDEGNEDPGKQ